MAFLAFTEEVACLTVTAELDNLSLYGRIRNTDTDSSSFGGTARCCALNCGIIPYTYRSMYIYMHAVHIRVVGITYNDLRCYYCVLRARLHKIALIFDPAPAVTQDLQFRKSATSISNFPFVIYHSLYHAIFRRKVGVTMMKT